MIENKKMIYDSVPLAFNVIIRLIIFQFYILIQRDENA